MPDARVKTNTSLRSVNGLHYCDQNVPCIKAYKQINVYIMFNKDPMTFYLIFKVY